MFHRRLTSPPSDWLLPLWACSAGCEDSLCLGTCHHVSKLKCVAHADHTADARQVSAAAGGTVDPYPARTYGLQEPECYRPGVAHVKITRARLSSGPPWTIQPQAQERVQDEPHSTYCTSCMFHDLVPYIRTEAPTQSPRQC